MESICKLRRKICESSTRSDRLQSRYIANVFKLFNNAYLVHIVNCISLPSLKLLLAIVYICVAYLVLRCHVGGGGVVPPSAIRGDPQGSQKKYKMGNR
jgi:hypothetical protein